MNLLLDYLQDGCFQLRVEWYPPHHTFDGLQGWGAVSRIAAELDRLYDIGDAAERAALLNSLLDLWKFGYNYGGIEVDIPGVIAGHATARERKRVEAWLREEMRPGQDSSSTWHNRSIVNFLVTLKQAGHCSDEDVLAEYRKVPPVQQDQTSPRYGACPLPGQPR